MQPIIKSEKILKKIPSLGQNLGNDYGVQRSNLVVTFC